jgi:MFS family permease
MLASITPLGERARGNRWIATAGMFITAGTIGGAAVGAAMGALGSLALSHVAIRWRLALLALVLAAGLIWELAAKRLPGPRRQVNERWLDEYRSWVYAVGFGAQLGAGVSTLVVSSAVYAVCAAALASASPLAGMVIGSIAGLLRAATLLAAARVVSAERLVSLHRGMRRLDRPVWRVLAAGQLALVGAAGLAMVVA